MVKKLNPLQAVSKEVAEHSDIDQGTIEVSLLDLLDLMQSRAMTEIEADPEADAARSAALQYRIVCELIVMFGTQLIAFNELEDIELPSGRDEDSN